MRSMYRLVCLLVILFMPVLIPCSFAQEGSVTPEEVYSSIRNIAFEGRLEEAEVMARELVREYPSYGDAIVLLSRIIAWQERYSEAIDMLDSLLAVQPGHKDAILARSTINEWRQSAQEKDDAGRDTIKAEQVTADTTATKQAAADTAATEQVTADTTATEQAAAGALNMMKADTASRDLDIHTGYSFDTFSQPYNRFWQIFRMGAGWETDLGPVLGTVNFGNLHAGTDPALAETGIQLQAEFWPQITENTYAWLAWAYSPFEYFPKHRASAEYWYGFDRGWVLSAGASYFYFDRNILIPALSVEKYLGPYWLSAKSHFHLKKAGTTASLFLTARRYSNDTDYIQLTAGAGTAPDEPWDLAADLDRQEAFSLKLGMKKKLNDNFLVRGTAGYSREQYNNDLWRNRFEVNINIIYSPAAK